MPFTWHAGDLHVLLRNGLHINRAIEKRNSTCAFLFWKLTDFNDARQAGRQVE